MRRLLVVALLALCAAGCGGGDGDGETAAQPAPMPTPTAVQTVSVPDTARPEPTPDGDPSFTVDLTGQSDEARAGEAWRFTVKATNAEGQPASGTAKMRVFADGELVDTIGFFSFEGTLTRTHRWPRALVGKDVVLQAEVEGDGGTQRTNLPVEVSS